MDGGRIDSIRDYRGGIECIGDFEIGIHCRN